MFKITFAGNNLRSATNLKPETRNQKPETFFMTTLYHNPRCSSSREALRLLEESGETIEVVKYLENPPNRKELKQLIELLGIKPIELVRTKEEDWKQNFKGKVLSDSQIIDAMIEFPRLIERPIAIKGTHAIIGRPPTKVLEIL